MQLRQRLSSEFFRHVITLVLGTGLAQIITFGGIIVLARIYDPGEQAFFTLFSSIASILTSIACLRYEFAIPLPEEKLKAKRIVVLATYVLFLISGLALLGLLVWNCFAFFAGTSFNPILYLVPLFTLFAGGTQIFNYWSTRIGTFNRNFISRVSAAAATMGFSIIFGWLTGNTIGLVLGAIIGQFVSWLVLAWKAMPELYEAYREATSEGLKKLAGEYKNFPLYNAPNALFDAFQDYGIIFVMNYYFIDEISALYFQSMRLLSAPLALIGAAIYQVFYPKMARNYAESGNVRKELLRIYSLLFMGALPFFVILFFFIDEAVFFLLGKDWMAAAPIMQVLIPWIFFNFLISPISGITLVTGKQKQGFLFSISGLILKFTALFIGGIYGSYYLGFVLMSIFGSCLMIAGMLWYWSIAKTKE